MGGLTFDKIFLILIIAMFVIGPDKLPIYAQKLGQFVRSFKRMADGAKGKLKEEMGPEFDDVDWRQLDPRQYDPRRIIRDALLEDEREARASSRSAGAAAAAGVAGAAAAAVSGAAAAAAEPKETGAFHYDDEAT